MPTRNLTLNRIGEVKLRDDGEKALLEFIGKDGKVFVISFTFEQLQSLESAIIPALTALRFNRGAHSDTPKSFSPARDVLLVNELELHLPPDGGIDFMITTRDGRSFQVSLHDEHGKMLRQILSGSGGGFRLG
jgi:hypothetical protein